MFLLRIKGGVDVSPRGHGSVYGEAAEPGMGPAPPPTAPLWPLQGSGPCLWGTRLQPLASAPEPACPGMALTSSWVPHYSEAFRGGSTVRGSQGGGPHCSFCLYVKGE